MSIRKAQSNDIPRIAELAAQRRVQYQHYQPQFWRVAEHAQEKHSRYLNKLLDRTDVTMLVHEESTGAIDGFIIADFVPAPPVYNPGGPTCRVDDFCVSSDDLWASTGLELLNEVLRKAKEQGAAQSVVVCGHLDQPKRTMLDQMGYSIASEWYVHNL